MAALRGPIHGAVAGWGVALVVYALYRTFWPLSYYEDSRSSLLALLAELGLTLTVVAATGYWNSPFVFTIISAHIVGKIEKIYFAETNGELRLTVRHYGDIEERPIAPMTQQDLFPRNLPNPFLLPR